MGLATEAQRHVRQFVRAAYRLDSAATALAPLRVDGHREITQHLSSLTDALTYADQGLEYTAHLLASGRLLYFDTGMCIGHSVGKIYAEAAKAEAAREQVDDLTVTDYVITAGNLFSALSDAGERAEKRAEAFCKGLALVGRGFHLRGLQELKVYEPSIQNSVQAVKWLLPRLYVASASGKLAKERHEAMLSAAAGYANNQTWDFSAWDKTLKQQPPQ